MSSVDKNSISYYVVVCIEISIGSDMMIAYILNKYILEKIHWGNEQSRTVRLRKPYVIYLTKFNQDFRRTKDSRYFGFQ